MNSIKLTPAVKFLLITCFVMFVVQHTGDQFLGTDFTGWLGLVPSRFVLHFQLWQLFTYPFLHADVSHLFLNLMVLAFIGGELEGLWGWRRFLVYYFTCSSAGGLLYLAIQMGIWGDSGLQTPMIGASGAIYGLLMAFGLIFGERTMLFMMLFPMKAKHFIWILVGIEFMTTLYSGKAGLSAAAHLGGMVAGLIYLFARASWIVYQRNRDLKGPAGGKKKSGKKGSSSNHLKLIVDNDQDKAAGKKSPDKPTIWH